MTVCCLGVLSVHRPNPNYWIVVAAWLATLTLLGIATLFLSIAVSTLLGIDEEEAGLLAWPPLIGMASGIITMTPAMLTLGVGVTPGTHPSLVRHYRGVGRCPGATNRDDHRRTHRGNS